MRQLLGPRLARWAGRRYRAIFVDLAKAAAAIAQKIPLEAHVLDIGGGDGEPLNHLLALRPDLQVTTLDPGPTVGQWIDARFEGRVTRMARTTLAQYRARGLRHPDVILLSDVMHHVPHDLRAELLADIGVFLERQQDLRIIVKDVEPGYWRASLGFWSDRYVTGDAGVDPISCEKLAALFQATLGPLEREDTPLFALDSPNYALAFHRHL